MGLTSEQSLIEIQKLFDMCFDKNSMFDRIVYVTKIKFNLIKFGDWFHQNIAHLVTGDNFADGIEAYGELSGDLFHRGAIPEHSENYSSVTSEMEAFVMSAVEIREQCVKALKTCIANNDEHYEDFLRDFNVRNISLLIKQATVFYEAVKQYEDNGDLRKWNKDFKSYIIEQYLGVNE